MFGEPFIFAALDAFALEYEWEALRLPVNVYGGIRLEPVVQIKSHDGNVGDFGHGRK